tara:strand:+ start:2681 stop:3250 length:570 start_codon:yes stop_codon:yes gene_type:complete
MKIEYPSQVFTEEEVKNMWNESWGDSYPYVLRGERGYANKYSTNNPLFFIALDGDTIVGASGWVDNDTFYTASGTRVARPYRKGGEMKTQEIASTLLTKRLNKIGNKPIVTGLSNKNLPTGVWSKHFEKTGWVANPNDTQVSNLPKEVVDYHRKKYGDNFLVYQPTAMAKAWNIVKSIDERMMIFFMED